MPKARPLSGKIIAVGSKMGLPTHVDQAYQVAELLAVTPSTPRYEEILAHYTVPGEFGQDQRYQTMGR